MIKKLNIPEDIYITIKWSDGKYDIVLHCENDDKFYNFLIDNIYDLIHQLQDFTNVWIRAKQKFYNTQKVYLKKEGEINV